MFHRLFFKRIAQNPDYVQTFCNDRRNLFHFPCCQWYSYNIPQKHCSILTRNKTRIIVYFLLYLYK